MAASARTQVMSLYRMMLRESSKFPSYNYRTYALRRVRDAFRANRKIEDPRTVERLMEEGQRTLALIQRQLSIMASQRLVKEHEGTLTVEISE
uniref:Complex 1 LYR protein domain-containing protein n=1 Tax=Scophthalmus maximus TaxID=52904 RepID=A0A8D3C3P4_SCOMX